MYDLLILATFAVLGLLAHAASKRRWLEWILRLTICFSVLLGLAVFSFATCDHALDRVLNPHSPEIMGYSALATLLSLFIPIRRLLSWLFTAVDLLVSGQVLWPLVRKTINATAYFKSKRIFVPSSVPHLVGLFAYITTVTYIVLSSDPANFQLPMMAVPMPLLLEQLFSYNCLGLVVLSFCGVGIYVSRKLKEASVRLGLVKPTWAQVGIGLLLVIASFTYDYLWALYTHNLGGQDLAAKLSMYNSGTFSVLGGFAPSVVLALATALCAGIGEETLIRGALQPVFGILPAALLHGMLHGQFAHAPIFIVQVAIWSMMMGIVRRYTNTTTTIIGHAGFNFVTTFLFAFNP